MAAPSTALPKKGASPGFTGYWEVSRAVSLNRNFLLNLILPSTQQQDFQETRVRNRKEIIKQFKKIRNVEKQNSDRGRERQYFYLVSG